jgi:hypothetical protein
MKIQTLADAEAVAKEAARLIAVESRASVAARRTKAGYGLALRSKESGLQFYSLWHVRVREHFSQNALASGPKRWSRRRITASNNSGPVIRCSL